MNMTVSKRLFAALGATAVALGVYGCVSINLPRQEPLAEKAIGGSGADRVLVIDLSGIITDAPARGPLSLDSPPSLTARVKEELDLAATDGRVKAVILRIDTPGGSVTACDIIGHEIEAFKKKKGGVPVVAELMGVAASGGYYIAASADRIIAHPTTVTGSIGVVAYSVSAAGLLDKIGIADQTVKSGAMKDMGSPLRSMTAEERKVIQGIIDSMHSRFIDVILKTRGGLITREELMKAADGRVYTAAQALDLKLIDAVGYMDDAVEAAKGLAGLKEATIITYAQPRAYRNNIYSSIGQPMPAINLVNIDASSFIEPTGFSFMYLWMP